MYYSANWQLLEERINEGWTYQATPIDDDRKMQYFWGPPETRYIDDIVARRHYNFNTEQTNVWYHLTDVLFSTVAIIDDAAKLVERVSYDAYGRARHHRMADLTGDGAVTTSGTGSDQWLLENEDWGDFGIGDLNRDGVVNNDDKDLLMANVGAALPAGQLSQTDNIIGFAGYVFNAEHAGGGLYTVRFRVYSPDLGRWITRDPIGYVDGMGLYQYVASKPLDLTDPSGLFKQVCREASPVGIDLKASMDVPPYVTASGGLSLGGRVKECEKCCRDGSRVTDEIWELEGDAYISIVGRSFGINKKIGRAEISGFIGLQGEIRMYGRAQGTLNTDRCNGQGLTGSVCGILGISGTLEVGGYLSVSYRWFNASVGAKGQAMIAGEMRLCLECDNASSVWHCDRRARLCVHGHVNVHISLFFFHWSGTVGNFEKCTAEQSF